MLGCEEARRRLLAGHDAEAEAHLAGCADCFEALEAGDPMAALLVAARPPAIAPGAGLADRVLARWRPGRHTVGGWGTVALAALAVLVGVVIESLVASDPGHVAAVAAAEVRSAVTLAGHWLRAAVALREIVLETPVLIGALSAVTLAAGALWLRLASGTLTWRYAP